MSDADDCPSLDEALRDIRQEARREANRAGKEVVFRVSTCFRVHPDDQEVLARGAAHAEGAFLYGVPVNEMPREELVAMVGDGWNRAALWRLKHSSEEWRALGLELELARERSKGLWARFFEKIGLL